MSDQTILERLMLKGRTLSEKVMIIFVVLMFIGMSLFVVLYDFHW